MEELVIFWSVFTYNVQQMHLKFSTSSSSTFVLNPFCALTKATHWDTDSWTSRSRQGIILFQDTGRSVKVKAIGDSPMIETEGSIPGLDPKPRASGIDSPMIEKLNTDWINQG